ncbi:UvrD-helicase domain-containing protein [Planococcus citreus]|uniref:UvrD/REP helicase N-terminal domain-containing protein n=1 Tax=Planococcus citreus TaxID=1373 RepID=A0A497YHW7_9BACL|nr:UvrD-helicase domain-containing protein [Planococcus citreus]RLJ90577.1 UvrD/REP helicase N-terminal domain-containing protein [Planococcus citreus]
MKLNMEQRRIVELEPGGPMLVKGVAGSGKTTVAIRRIHFLMDHYCHEEDDQILLVTYNKTLLNYIKFQYERLADAAAGEAERLFASNAEVKIATIDSLMYGQFMKYLQRTKRKLAIAPGDKEWQVLTKAIHEVKKSHPDVIAADAEKYEVLERRGGVDHVLRDGRYRDLSIGGPHRARFRK